MNILRKKILTPPISLFFLLLYAGVYISAGFWHNHQGERSEKASSVSKNENCSYCKIVSNNAAALSTPQFFFSKTTINGAPAVAITKIHWCSILVLLNKAPPAKA